jgi:LCP family protein required for cell wall assembly
MENRSTHKKKSKKKKIIFGTLSIILVAILSVAGYYAYHIYQFTNKIQVKEPTKAKAKMVATKEWTGGRVNILLMGGDTRKKNSSDNSDSMILLSADPETHQAQMFSIMRDTLWKIPEHSYQKINASNLIGGPELAVQTVEDFLDIPINFYVETDFQGFKKMVDILGGVDINVDEDMNYDDLTDGTSIHLKMGKQHLNGKLALDYARFRHDAMGDFNRTKRQRELLKTLAAKTSTTYGVLKIPQLLDGLAPYVQTNMTTTNMLEIATLLHKVNVSELQTEQLPQMEDILQTSVPKFGSVLIPNVLATRQHIHQLLGMNDTPTATAAEQYYWNLYKNGGSGQASNTQPASTTRKTTSGSTSSTRSSYRTSTSQTTSSTTGVTRQATSQSSSASSSTTQSSGGSTSSSTSSTATQPSSGSTSSPTIGSTSLPSSGSNGGSTTQTGSSAGSTGGSTTQPSSGSSSSGSGTTTEATAQE